MGEPMRKLKIVLADDEPDVRELVTDGLTQRGHTVVVVQSGAELLRLLANGLDDFDVIVTDNTMPGGPNGLEVMRQLRQDSRFKDMPIILHTRGEGEELRAAVNWLHGMFAPKRADNAPLFTLIDSIPKK